MPTIDIVHVVLGMRRISAKWLLKYLNIDQKDASVEATRSIYARFEKDADFISRMVTMDEISTQESSKIPCSRIGF